MSLFDVSFFKRLGFYLFGLSIGIVFLAFFFKKKTEETGVSFCYFPNCRTLKDMRSKPVAYSENISALLKNQELDTLDIKTFLTEGEVDFSASDTKSVPCKNYVVAHELKGKSATLEVKNCPDKVIIESLK